jgi:hypothetical protein
LLERQRIATPRGAGTGVDERPRYTRDTPTPELLRARAKA